MKLHRLRQDLNESKRFYCKPTNFDLLIKPSKLNQTLVCNSIYLASGSEITPCNKIDKQLVVYRFS